MTHVHRVDAPEEAPRVFGSLVDALSERPLGRESVVFELVGEDRIVLLFEGIEPEPGVFRWLGTACGRFRLEVETRGPAWVQAALAERGAA
jgi:hypothetical protein